MHSLPTSMKKVQLSVVGQSFRRVLVKKKPQQIHLFVICVSKHTDLHVYSFHFNSVETRESIKCI